MSKTGRYTFTDPKSGRTFYIEPITPRSRQNKSWGDVDPATKKVTGSYGDKHKGSVEERESIITEENGFKNIVTLPAGTSPEGYIKQLLKNENVS